MGEARMPAPRLPPLETLSYSEIVLLMAYEAGRCRSAPPALLERSLRHASRHAAGPAPQPAGAEARP